MLRLQDFQSIDSGVTWVTIGSFDGVHKGHQELIQRMVSNAHRAGALAAVVTFYPHPAVVLGKRPGNINLTTPDERAEYIQELGVDILVTQEFNASLAATPAREYIFQLSNSLNVKVLWIGHDFALGRDREGDHHTLQKFGAEMGFAVEVVDAVQTELGVISSSQIRNHLWMGEVDRAGQLLGRPYCLTGEVISGDQRGRTIGIPTANLDIPEEKLIPARGVYACLAILGDRKIPAATNIGVRPTFDGNNELLHVETHLLDFSGDLYGQYLKLEFIQYLRSEIRFTSIDALVEQIHLDIKNTRSIVSVRNHNP